LFACLLELTLFRRGHGPGRFQHDAHEFLRALCNAVAVASLAPFKFGDDAARNFAELTTLPNVLFGFDVKRITRCDECGSACETNERVLDLDIPIPDTNACQQLRSLIASMFADEQLVGREQYECNACGRHCDAVRQTIIDSTPAVLIVHLMRFGFGNDARKLATPVAVLPRMEFGGAIYELVRRLLFFELR